MRKIHASILLGLVLLGAGCATNTTSNTQPLQPSPTTSAPIEKAVTATQPTQAPALKVIDALNSPASAKWPKLNTLPKSAREVAKLPQSLCPPNADVVCGFNYVFSEVAGQLYITIEGGAGAAHYGPIGASSDILPTVTAISRYLNTLKF